MLKVPITGNSVKALFGAQRPTAYDTMTLHARTSREVTAPLVLWHGSCRPRLKAARGLRRRGQTAQIPRQPCGNENIYWIKKCWSEDEFYCNDTTAVHPVHLQTRNSAIADKPARRVYRSVKVTKHSTIPYVRYSFLLCNSKIVFKTRRFYDIRLQKCRELEIRVRSLKVIGLC